MCQHSRVVTSSVQNVGRRKNEKRKVTTDRESACVRKRESKTEGKRRGGGWMGWGWGGGRKGATATEREREREEVMKREGERYCFEDAMKERLRELDLVKQRKRRREVDSERHRN